MIFELADDLITDLTTGEVAALELVLQARRQGYHVLTGNEDVFTFLATIEGLSEMSRVILRKAMRRQIQKAGLLEAVSHHIRISHSVGPTVEKNGRSRITTLPLSHFRYHSASDRSVVLGENVLDARLATEMARYYAASRGMGHVALQFRHDGGGGTTTAQSFRSHRDDPRLCVCIVDSDSGAPGAVEGTTASAVLAEVDSSKSWAAAVTTGCREAENTLPGRIVEIAMKDDRQLLRRVSGLDHLAGSVVSAGVRDHCDLKKGTNLESVLEPNDEVVREFWLNIAPSLAALPGLREDCVEALRCLNEGDCNCWIVRGFGRTLLKQSLSTVEEMDPEEIEEALCDATRPHWVYIGSEVFSWICGTTETRV